MASLATLRAAVFLYRQKKRLRRKSTPPPFSAQVINAVSQLKSLESDSFPLPSPPRCALSPAAQRGRLRPLPLTVPVRRPTIRPSVRYPSPAVRRPTIRPSARPPVCPSARLPVCPSARPPALRPTIRPASSYQYRPQSHGPCDSNWAAGCCPCLTQWSRPRFVAFYPTLLSTRTTPHNSDSRDK